MCDRIQTSSELTLKYLEQYPLCPSQRMVLLLVEQLASDPDDEGYKWLSIKNDCIADVAHYAGMLSYQVFEIVLSLVKYGALDRLDDRLMISGQFKSLPSSLKEWAKRKNFDRKKAMTECTNRDGPGCIVCGTLDDLQIDHIHPIARGGGNEIGNLQILCGECNREKRTKTMYEWIADS